MISINSDAHNIAALHFAKHGLGDCVFGVFLGKGEEITEAIPLFHTFVLQPSLIVAMGLIEEYAKPRSLEILGVYSKTAACAQTSLSVLKKKVGCFIFDGAEFDKNGILFSSAKNDENQLKRLVEGEVFLKLCDLDDHFNDPSKDFLSNSVLLGCL